MRGPGSIPTGGNILSLQDRQNRVQLGTFTNTLNYIKECTLISKTMAQGSLNLAKLHYFYGSNSALLSVFLVKSPGVI